MTSFLSTEACGRCGLGAEQAQCEKERQQAEVGSVRARESASSVAVLNFSRIERATKWMRKWIREEPLFLSETDRPLSENGIALLFGRPRKRAGTRRKETKPTMVRKRRALQHSICMQERTCALRDVRECSAHLVSN